MNADAIRPANARSRALGAAVGGAGAAGMFLFLAFGPGTFLPLGLGLALHAAGGAVGGAAGFRYGGPVVAALVTVGPLLWASGGDGIEQVWPSAMTAVFAAVWANLAELEVRRG